MRYKIGFEFPWLEQRHLQHAHSHFAFGGWVSHMLMVLIADTLSPQFMVRFKSGFQWLFGMNTISALGMLIGFTIQGYGTFSIVCSTLSIAVFIGFMVLYYRVARAGAVSRPADNWFKVALWMGVISIAGTASLSYMMVTRQMTQELYLASVYWYLHFQYNGWFLFACMGLLMHYFGQNGIAFRSERNLFLVCTLCVIPTFGLSVLWMNLPNVLLVIVALSAIAQLIAWINWFREVIQIPFWRSGHVQRGVKYFFLYAAVAFTIKLVLQAGSTVPEVSKLAFGFRNVVIAYLHLVLLAVISAFIMAYAFARGYLGFGKLTFVGMIGLLGTVFLNEVILAVQGIASFTYVLIPGINVLLLIAAIGIMCSIALVLVGMRRWGHKEVN